MGERDRTDRQARQPFVLCVFFFPWGFLGFHKQWPDFEHTDRTELN